MKKIYLTLFILFFSLSLMAQEVTISGTVTTADDGQPLPGATVVEKGTSNGTITNLEGSYTLTVAPDATILISFVGLESMEIPVEGRTVIDAALVTASTDLDEIVVIGYGVQKKSLVTGAISKVGAEDLQRNQVRIEQALQGKTAGVNIVTESGSPGGGLTVRIRGTGTNRNSNPLFIVDGMRTGGIDYLNPNDIESVEILKDAASAAIYGAEGGNGVIMITTKSGDSGRTSLSYSGYYGIQEARKLNEVLNAKEYATYYRSGLEDEIRDQYEGFEIPQALLDRLLDSSYPFNPDTLGAGTDWVGEIFGPAPIQEHNISLSGGNEKTSIFLSGSYFNQQGIVGGPKSNYDRYTARLNADHKAKDWLTISGKLSFTHLERKTIDENNEFGGVISNAMNIDPLTPVYSDRIPDKYINQVEDKFDDIDNSSLRAGDKGYYGMSEYVQNEIRNPVAQIDNTHNRYYQDKFLGGISATIEPIEGLSLRTAYDIDLAYGNNNYWTPQFYYHSVLFNELSSVNQVSERFFTWQWENVLTYNRQFGPHDLTLLAGNTMRNYNYYFFGGLGEDLQEESWDFAVFDAVLKDSTRSAVSGTRAEDRLLSYFGRVQYNYDGKYLLGLTLRSDASSKLSSENRTQYFPSVSLGWIISSEGFWNFEPVNFMKLRFSWGQNGSIQSLGNFEYISTISSNALSSYYVSGGNRIVGAEPDAISNPELKWETSEQLNIGLDMRFLQNRLSFTADYYNKITRDLITTASIPEYVGNNKPPANVGDIVNRGVELELSYRGNAGNLGYQIGTNLAYNENEFTTLESPLLGANLGTSGVITRSDQGLPIWYFYGYEADGIFDSKEEIEAYVNEEGDLIQPAAIPGDVKFRDINGDGSINEDDKTFIGSPHPDWIFGLNLSLDYKGFDLSVFLNGTIGNEVYFGSYRNDINANNKPSFFYDNGWTPEDPSKEFPRYTVNDNNNNFSHSDLFVFDGSYVRLQNVELGYTLPPSVLERLKIQNFRVYVSGKNLFVLSDYPGADPEIGNSTGGNDKTSIGIDRGLYPRPRIISFGVNLTL